MNLSNREVNRRLKQEFQKRGKYACCEICGSTYNLSFHHRLKRRHYKLTPELLYDFNSAILVCTDPCHYRLEHGYTDQQTGKRVTGRELTRQIFGTLRPDCPEPQ